MYVYIYVYVFIIFCLYNLYLYLYFTIIHIKTSSVKLNFYTRNISLLYSYICLHIFGFDFELSNR